MAFEMTSSTPCRPRSQASEEGGPEVLVFATDVDAEDFTVSVGVTPAAITIAPRRYPPVHPRLAEVASRNTDGIACCASERVHAKR